MLDRTSRQNFAFNSHDSAVKYKSGEFAARCRINSCKPVIFRRVPYFRRSLDSLSSRYRLLRIAIAILSSRGARNNDGKNGIFRRWPRNAWDSRRVPRSLPTGENSNGIVNIKGCAECRYSRVKRVCDILSRICGGDMAHSFLCVTVVGIILVCIFYMG